MTRPATLRLDRLLAGMGYGSRATIEKLARAGRIKLDDAALLRADQKLALTQDLPERLWIDGEALDPLPGMILMLNKPAGVTCSHKEAGPLVYDLLPPRWISREPPLSSVGRLDKETSGLLLLTDDGVLLHKIISPKAAMAKRYRAELARPLLGHEGELFASGKLLLEGEERPLAPARLEIEAPQRASLTITEGRYHQVRRMFAAVGNRVLALHRDRIGGLDLPDSLRAGAYRVLDAADRAAVFAA